jgi:ADP-ribosylglycohydrolase
MELIDRIRASLLAHRAGEGLGMPYETMKREKILASTGGRGVTEMDLPVQRTLKDTKDLPRGAETDDWTLTRACAESLIARGGHDLEHQARAHVQAVDTFPFGFGYTTLVGLRQVRGFFSGASWGRSPEAPAPCPRKKGKSGAPGVQGRGRGNAVGMKIAPHALWHALRQERFEPEPLLSQVMELGRMTHSDIRASIAGYALAVTVAKCLREPIVTRHDATSFVRFLIAQVKIAEDRYRFVLDDPDTVSGRLARFDRCLGSADNLREGIGCGFDSMESIPFSIGVFLRQFDHPERALTEAVNAGGDTDTNGAMTGSMVGVNAAGIYDTTLAALLPSRWTEALPDKGKGAIDLGTRLYQAACV